MKTKTLWMLGLVCILLVGTANDSMAFKRMPGNPSWPFFKIPVSWWMNQDGSQDVHPDDCEAALKNSFQTWQNVSGAYIEFSYNGKTDTGKDMFGRRDGINLLVWEEDTWPQELGDAIAVTQVASEPNPKKEGEEETSRIVDADILFNGVNYKWAIDGSGNKMDIQNVATHEIGHFLGLADLDDNQNATMYGATQEGDLHSRDLDADDKAGTQAIYPGDTVPEDKAGKPCDNNCVDDNHFCAQDFGKEVCSHVCSFQDDCPDHFICMQVLGSGEACFYEGDSEFGGNCNNFIDCPKNLLCRKEKRDDGLSSIQVCTQNCETDDECPEGYLCKGTTSEDKACFNPIKVDFWEDCSAVGCKDDLTCETRNDMTLCTKLCTTNNDCPKTADPRYECIQHQGKNICWEFDSTPEAELTSFEGNPPSPINPGTKVTFTADSEAPHGGGYRFFVTEPGGKAELKQDWGKAATFEWTATKIGTVKIKVQAKDARSQEAFDSQMELTYVVEQEVVVDGDTDTDGPVITPTQQDDGGGGGCSTFDPSFWVLALLGIGALRRRR